MIIDEMSGSYRAKIDAFERGLQAKNLEFANWLVESAERQQKAPKELLNEILTLALQAKQ
jgi:succinate dehydrogenase flavin-adding protein (antitoxin of CptAB toxin-antitoxin module)